MATTTIVTTTKLRVLYESLASLSFSSQTYESLLKDWVCY